MRSISWLAAGAVALAVGCASSNTAGSPGTASSPGTTGTSQPAMAGAPQQTVSGGIQNYTTGPSGQQNGFVLSSGQRVHVPEAMAAKVADQFPPSTLVQVTGTMITDSDGRPVLEASTIKAPDRNATLDLGPAQAAPASPAAGPSSVGGSGPASSEPVNPPAGNQPSTPPPAGR